MKRRDFLKSMAAMVGWFAVGCMPAKESAKEAPKETARRGYYHILLISDLHLPVRSKKFPGQAEQADVWQKKLRLLKTVNAWGDVDEAALLGDLAARYGSEPEFHAADEYLGSLKFPYYAVAGNHDYAYKDEPRINSKGKEKMVPGTLEEKIAKLAAFQKRYKQPGLYYARSVGDCRLLYLAPDACGTYVEFLNKGRLMKLGIKKIINVRAHTLYLIVILRKRSVWPGPLRCTAPDPYRNPMQTWMI